MRTECEFFVFFLFFSLTRKEKKIEKWKNKIDFVYIPVQRGENYARASETKDTSYVFAPIGKQTSTRSADPIAAAGCPTFTDNSLALPPWFRIIHSHCATSVDCGSDAQHLRRSSSNAFFSIRRTWPIRSCYGIIISTRRPTHCF